MVCSPRRQRCPRQSWAIEGNVCSNVSFTFDLRGAPALVELMSQSLIHCFILPRDSIKNMACMFDTWEEKINVRVSNTESGKVACLLFKITTLYMLCFQHWHLEPVILCFHTECQCSSHFTLGDNSFSSSTEVYFGAFLVPTNHQKYTWLTWKDTCTLKPQCETFFGFSHSNWFIFHPHLLSFLSMWLILPVKVPHGSVSRLSFFWWRTFTVQRFNHQQEWVLTFII